MIRAKPQPGRTLLACAFAAGMPCASVTADSIYGGDYGLRRFTERHGCGYVLVVTSMPNRLSVAANRPREAREALGW
jgi:hypothetical protein